MVGVGLGLGRRATDRNRPKGVARGYLQGGVAYNDEGHPLLTLLGPHSRFGDKLLTVRVICPHIWECGAKRVNTINTGVIHPPSFFVLRLFMMLL